MDRLTSERLAKRFEESGGIVTRNTEIVRMIFRYDSFEKAEALQKTLGIGIVRLKYQSLDGHIVVELKISGKDNILYIANAILPYLTTSIHVIRAVIDYYKCTKELIQMKYDLIQIIRDKASPLMIPKATDESEEPTDESLSGKLLGKTHPLEFTETEHIFIYEHLELRKRAKYWGLAKSRVHLEEWENFRFNYQWDFWLECMKTSTGREFIRGFWKGPYL